MRKTLFHATGAEFSAFDLDTAGRGEGHLNSTLGIWFATRHDWISGFGHRVLEAEVELGRDFERVALASPPVDCSDAELDEATRNPWLDQRRRLLAGGYDSVDLVEADGRVEMHVAMRAECISGFREMASAPSPR
jgi:hypothetical protein